MSHSTTIKRPHSGGTEASLPHSEASEQLRALCLKFPGVVEYDTPGQITFKVGHRPFVVLETFRDTDGNFYRCLAFKASFFDHEQLSSHPDFFPAPYLGGSGWLGCRLDGDRAPWDIERLSVVLGRSHRQIAGRMVFAKRAHAAAEEGHSVSDA